jgi:hypothetical protein
MDYLWFFRELFFNFDPDLANESSDGWLVTPPPIDLSMSPFNRSDRMPMLEAVMPLEGRVSLDLPAVLIMGGSWTCDMLCRPFMGIFEGCLSLSDCAASSAANMELRLWPPRACRRSYLRLK